MKSTLRIAWRNLWRNGRRTALAVGAIGLSVTLVLVYDGVLRGYGDWLVATITGPLLGHVQVHATSWRTDRALDRTLTGVAAAVAELREDPRVASASARLYGPSLAALEEEGFAVVVLGADMTAESGPGRLLAGVSTTLDDHQVLIGRALADQMGAREGDVLALVSQGADGSVANDLFTIAARIETSVDLVNRQAIVMPLAAAQEFFVLQDEAHEIVVHARDAARVPELEAAIAARPAFARAEVLDWRALAPEMVNLVALLDVAWIFVLVLVLMAAVAGVVNTMLMATFERIHELGMLLALGTTPSRIVGLVVAESLALAAVGTVVGAVLGVALVTWAGHTGVDYAALTGRGPSAISFAGLRWSLTLYPRLAPVDLARVIVAVGVNAVAAAAWPAVRAARLQPATALRS